MGHLHDLHWGMVRATVTSLVADDCPPFWSSSGALCLLENIMGTHAPHSTGNPPLDPHNLNWDPHVANMTFHPACCAFAPGMQTLIMFDRRWYIEQCTPGSTLVNHRVYDASTKSSVRQVPGFTSGLAGSLQADGIAWHPTLKPAALYALAERRVNAAVHLIGARRHCRLITWTCKDLEGILQKPFCSNNLLAAWSPDTPDIDGMKLAVANKAGTVILTFACGPARPAGQPYFAVRK